MVNDGNGVAVRFDAAVLNPAVNAETIRAVLLIGRNGGATKRVVLFLKIPTGYISAICESRDLCCGGL